ncbi:21978_t:CDS:2 [Entrophospora sp. SA101]|nr:21978_t:CDS:2 [Entrophospora sp. SA101]
MEIWKRSMLSYCKVTKAIRFWQPPSQTVANEAAVEKNAIIFLIIRVDIIDDDGVCSSKIGRRFISSFILTDIPTIFSARALRPRVLPKKPSTDWREEIRKGIVTDKTGKNSFE